MALTCISRLLWVYLFRWKEPDSSTFKVLDSLLKVLFPDGKKHVVPQVRNRDVHLFYLTRVQDTSLERFVQIVHMIALRNTDFALKRVSSTLLHAGEKNASADNLGPERIMIAVHGARSRRLTHR